MKLSSRDYIFIFISSVVTIVASVLLYVEMTSFIDAGDRIVIGTITFKKKQAERKYRGRAIWEEVQQKSPVYNFDTIKTDENSSAVITLKDGSDFSLDENSLILVKMLTNKINLKVDKGTVTANRGSMDMSLSKGETNVKLAKGSSVNLAIDKKGINLDVNKGNALVKKGQSSLALSKNKGVRVEKKGVRKLSVNYRLVSPQSSEILVSKGRARRVIFNYSSAKKSAPYLILKRQRRGKVVYRKRIYKKIHTLKLSSGTYYWTISDKPNEASYRFRPFIVLSSSVPSIVQPSYGKVISYFGSKPLVSMSWRGGNNASYYTLEVAKQRSFRKIYKSIKTNTKSISLDELRDGKYFVRIKSHYPMTKARFISSVSVFNLRKSFAPKKISIVTLNGKVFSMNSSGKAQRTLQWRNSDDYRSYEVEVSKSPYFKGKKNLYKTSSNYISPKELKKSGTYYWRVRGVDSSGKKHGYSSSSKIRVLKKVSIKLKNPRIVVNNGKRDMVFSWYDPSRSGKYEVILSRDPSFKKIFIIRKTHSSRLVIKNIAPGPVYWKVQIKSKSQIVGSSKRGLIYSPETIVGPRVISPKNNTVINVLRKNSIGFYWFPSKNTSYYKLTLYAYKGGFKRKIFSTTTWLTFYHFKKFELMNTGTYLWEIKAVKTRNKMIAAQSSAVKNIFIVTLGVKPKKIEVTSKRDLIMEY